MVNEARAPWQEDDPQHPDARQTPAQISTLAVCKRARFR